MWTCYNFYVYNTSNKNDDDDDDDMESKNDIFLAFVAQQVRVHHRHSASDGQRMK